MSWWDTSGLTSFATNVVKSAQKKIDKVLDIDEDPEDVSRPGASVPKKKASSSRKKKDESEGDFWNAWLGSPSEKSKDKPADTSSSSFRPKPSGEKKNAASSWRSWGLEESKTESSEEEGGKASLSPLSKTSRPARNKPRQKQEKDEKKETVEEPQADLAGAPASGSSVVDKLITEPDQMSVSGRDVSEFGNVSEDNTSASDGKVLISETTDLTMPDARIDKALSTDDGSRDLPLQDSAVSLSVSETVTSAPKHVPEEVFQDSVAKNILPSVEQKAERTSVESLSETNSVIEKLDPVVSVETKDATLSEGCGMDSVFSEQTDQHQCHQSSSEHGPESGESQTLLGKDSDNIVESELPALQISEPEGLNVSGEGDLKESDDTLQLPDIPDAPHGDSQEGACVGSSQQPDLLTEHNVSEDKPDSDKLSTSSSLAVPDQPLDKSGSVSSSMEFVSETEVVRLTESRETVNVIPECEDMARGELTLDSNPDGGKEVHLIEASAIDTVSVLVDSAIPAVTDRSGGDTDHRLEEDVVSADSTMTEDRADEPEAVVETADTDAVTDDIAMQDKDSGSDDNAMTVSSSSSVVKTMLEEAMEEKHEECDSHSHSSSDKSDFVKSEFSDKYISGHESGDEIDTTTSSDIEIISTPTPNGDRDRPFDLSPLKIALSRAGRHSGPTHRRTDSQSSSSTNSKPEQMSPGRDQEFSDDAQEAGHTDQGHFQQKPTGIGCSTSQTAPEEKASDPYETNKLLKKMAEMAEVITARENKLVQLSKENNDLLEANSILRNQLKQSEDNHEAELADLNAITEEFTQRLGEAERKVQAVLREKDSLKKQLEITQNEVIKKGDTSKFQKMLAEKDEQIEELLQEGEKLSKQQLQGNTIIKKLRAKEKETEQLVQSQKKKLESHTAELEHLKKVLDSKEEMEKKQSDAINQLNSAVQRQEKEFVKAKGELDENLEKMRGLQTALDASYKEIAELHRANAAKDSQAQEVAVSAEMQAREELRFTMEREQQRYRQEKEALVMQIEDLRISLSRMEKEHGRREDMLRQEVADLQQRLQEDEARNQELTQSVTSATRPLLRQIENLQSTYNAQSNSWETVEKNITERLGDAQNQLAVAVEKERVASEKVLELQTQVTTLEAQNTRYRQDKSQLTAQHEMLKTKVEMLEDSRNSDLAQVEAVKQAAAQELNDLKREKILLENQLEMEKTKVETEKKKVVLLQDQLKDKERERPLSRNTPSPSQLSRQESIASVSEPLTQLPAFTQEELLERSLMMTPHSPNGNKLSLYESLRHTGAANLLDSLISQLKQREGEITQLQSEIGELERTRESMARELVNLSTENDDLRDQIEGLPLLEAKAKELEQRYNALLQMYGEKVEETEELRLDLQDVKELYKSQIDHLMKGH